jgi:hypothetical protein
MSAIAAKQHLLVHEMKNTHEYDPKKALHVWRLLRAEIPQGHEQGYKEYPAMTDDDRIICLFELLDGSIFGDMIFSDLADFDQGSTLIERDEDA